MLTRENTSKLHQLNRFCHEKHQLETELESLTTGQVSLLTTAVFGSVQKWVRDYLSLTSSLVSNPDLQSEFGTD